MSEWKLKVSERVEVVEREIKIVSSFPQLSWPSLAPVKKNMIEKKIHEKEGVFEKNVEIWLFLQNGDQNSAFYKNW